VSRTLPLLTRLMILVSIMARLRWIIDTEGDFPREDDSGYQTHHDTPLAQHEKVATLEWTLPPNCSPSYPITEFVAHLRRVWQNETTLSLPTYWPVNLYNTYSRRN
jgi:hypothetical protein